MGEITPKTEGNVGFEGIYILYAHTTICGVYTASLVSSKIHANF